MDENTRWKIIIAKRFKRQLPLDIEYCSPISIRAILLDVRTPAHILDRIAQAYCDDQEVMHDLVLCPNLDETTLAFIALTSSDEIRSFIAGTRVMEVVFGDAATEEKTEPVKEKKKLNVMQVIQRMNMSQKIKLAMSGAKEARGLLIRESSKIIAMGVLSNPKLTIGEVEFFAKSTNLSEDVIRKIGTNAEWTRKPAVISALVNNPKTPVGISLGFIPRMSMRELGILEMSRNIPEAVRSTARNLIVKKKLGKA
ncbi:MAG: hypothetical protein M0R70_06045 [Nitrospirae bacterium]|nr:hypothetical protein [Nitrospirota bacterium]